MQAPRRKRPSEIRRQQASWHRAMTRTLADSGGGLIALSVLVAGIPALLGIVAGPLGALGVGLLGMLLTQFVPARPVPLRGDLFFRSRDVDRPAFMRQLHEEIRQRRTRWPMVLACTPFLVAVAGGYFWLWLQHPPEPRYPAVVLWLFDFGHVVLVSWGVQLLQVRRSILRQES